MCSGDLYARGYKFPREVSCRWVWVYWCVKLNQATRCLLRSFGQIYHLFSSIDLYCTCKQSRILAVHVSRSALQSRFTKQFFSTSRFTDTKNGRSRRHPFRACAKAIRYTVNIALIRSQYATSFKNSAGVFFGRECFLLAKAPCWNSKEEEMGRVKNGGYNTDALRNFFALKIEENWWTFADQNLI